MSKITISQIAKQAGFGKATVSRVLNNSGYVKQETRDKVERVMKENARRRPLHKTYPRAVAVS